ncbi:MAG: TRASH domain-containing protein [Planctomycetota bacterium]|nr:TRASH domain-containing protein [Planctomycetaceae bacterium]MDQ3330976.1 TRASH domain-containing protein [Planctomycetota bacterium]
MKMKWNGWLCGVLLAGTAVVVAQAPSGQPADALAVRKALKPLQVVVGRWRGNTFRENTVHEASWAWDHTTNPKQPALVMTAAKNPFFREARLSFEPSSKKYLLTLSEPTGGQRVLEGNFIEEPQDRVGDDGRSLQRTYAIQFEQVEPQTGERWRVTLNQQENNRFLVELAKRRGTAPFRRFDTVSSQREGTSFALTEEGYGEKTCVISGGLGTTAVSHGGRTYYVCCSGCEAAFKDDPEKWIAEYEKSKAAK